MAIETIVLAVGPMDAVRAEELADVVLEVAAPLEAAVVVTHAFTAEEYEEIHDDLGFDERFEDVDPDAVAARRAPVPDLVERFGAEGVDLEVRGVVGEHGQAVVDLAESVDADRIVVGGRRRSAAGKAVFGSTSQQIMQSAHCPVTYVHDRSVME